MKFYVAIIGTTLLLSSVAGCSSKKRIEKLARRTVVEQKAKLPTSVGHSIQLVNIKYDSFFNELRLQYDVADRPKFDRDYKTIQRDLNLRVQNDAGLKKLLDNRVKIVHEFRGGAREGELPNHTEFETKR